MPIHCTHISTKSVEVEALDGLHGSKMVKLELNAMHDGKMALIKILCVPKVDILNEKNKHSIRDLCMISRCSNIAYQRSFIKKRYSTSL